MSFFSFPHCQMLFILYLPNASKIFPSHFQNNRAEEFDCVQKAIERIEMLEPAKNGIAVLVTGSLRLVGGVLAALKFHVGRDGL